METPETDNHYVDNKRLYAEVVKYVNAYKEAKAENREPPQASNYIGHCISKIASGLSTTRNFIGYTYREDMIGDGIENCFRYLHNFDPEKSSNPFAYFTQIIYYAFLRRIDKEKKQTYIKYKSMQNSQVMNTLVEMAPDDQSHFNAYIATMDLDKLSSLSEKYETKATPKAKKKAGLEKFFGEDENE